LFYFSGIFVSNLSSTLGVDFQVKTIRVDGRNIALQLWDTAGTYILNILFHPTLLVEIRTLVTWLKSTLLLKIKYFDTHVFIWKHNVYKQIRPSIIFGERKNAWEVGGVRDRVGINKKFNLRKMEKTCLGVFVKAHSK